MNKTPHTGTATRKQNNSGFTLVELSISTAVMIIVSLLGYVVISTSTQSSRLADAQAQMQANLRDVMLAIESEVRAAYSNRSIDPKNLQQRPNSDIPVGTISVQVSTDKRSLQFQRPVPSAGSHLPTPSSVITLALHNEDVGKADGNAVLDAGEDANGDGILNRRLLRTQSGTTAPLGAVNDIADVQFTLVKNQDASDNNLTTLLVRLIASKSYGLKRQIVKADLESRIHLEN